MTEFLLGLLVGAILASLFWGAAIVRYFSSPANVRKMVRMAAAKGYRA